MAIRPDKPSPLWDEYPLDDTSLPATPPEPAGPSLAVPLKIAGVIGFLLLIAGLLAVGQSDGDDDTDVSQSPRTSTPAALPFDDEPTTTTTTAPTVRMPEEAGWAVTGEAYFSGCLPGTDLSLPDGIWFGYVTGIEPTEIEFDLACHYGIQIIDGLESPFVENSDKTRRLLPLSAEVEIYTLAADDVPIGPLGASDYVVEGWIDGRAGAVITVADGLVVEIDHQLPA